ncbi:MAG: SDR family oxidoreductase [Janthinobacterium lividum]
MSRILVTGATGNLGSKTMEYLLEIVPASDLVALARDPEKAAQGMAKGVEVRRGDYADYASLLQAFRGVEKVMMISTHAFTDRETEHANVIRAAKETGVKHLVHNPVIQKPGTGFDLVRVTASDRYTVDLLKQSGLNYTILAQPPFLESFEFILGANVATTGVRVPVGDGKVGAAFRDDLAEAQAVVLTSPGHENKSYNLTGGPAVSFAEIAEILTAVHGKQIDYTPLSDAEYLREKVAAGLPQPVAEFALGWAKGVVTGQWDVETGDLERLIGHKPLTASEFYASK